MNRLPCCLMGRRCALNAAAVFVASNSGSKHGSTFGRYVMDAQDNATCSCQPGWGGAFCQHPCPPCNYTRASCDATTFHGRVSNSTKTKSIFTCNICVKRKPTLFWGMFHTRHSMKSLSHMLSSLIPPHPQTPQNACPNSLPMLFTHSAPVHTVCPHC